MSTYATLTWESTPALWRAYVDPEGEQGFGKTKEEALDELIEQICEGMRESAKDAKIAELTRSLAEAVARAELAEAAYATADRIAVAHVEYAGERLALITEYVAAHDEQYDASDEYLRTGSVKADERHSKAIEQADKAHDALLAYGRAAIRNPNPSGHIMTEPSGGKAPEDSGPVGLGPDDVIRQAIQAARDGLEEDEDTQAAYTALQRVHSILFAHVTTTPLVDAALKTSQGNHHEAL